VFSFFRARTVSRPDRLT